MLVVASPITTRLDARPSSFRRYRGSSRDFPRRRRATFCRKGRAARIVSYSIHRRADHARRQIAGRDNFGKCERRQRFRGRDEHDGAVAAQDYWRDQRDKLKQRGSSGQMTTTTPVGSGIVKLKCELATGFTAPKIWPNLSVQPA